MPWRCLASAWAERIATIAERSKESPQQNLESPALLATSEQQIPTDSNQGQQDEEQPSLPAPEPIAASEQQLLLTPSDLQQHFEPSRQQNCPTLKILLQMQSAIAIRQVSDSTLIASG